MPRPKSPISRKARTLLRNYAAALENDSWKGGGDPAKWDEIELDLAQRTEKLHKYIGTLERRAAYAALLEKQVETLEAELDCAGDNRPTY